MTDIHGVQDFPKVFPYDLLGLPPERKVEFKIDVFLGTTLIAKAPYHLAPTKVKESMTQL